MLDIKFVRENSEKVKKAITNKGIKLDLDQLLEIAEKRSALLTRLEEINQKRNSAAKDQNINLGLKLKTDAKKTDDELDQINQKYNKLMYMVPNIIDKSTPIGGEEKNLEIRKWGEPTKFDFKAKDHIEIGKDLDLIDIEAGVKTSGFRGYYLKNQLVILHWAVLRFALDKLRAEGFSPMLPPTLLKEFALLGSGHFPFGYDEVYRLGNKDANDKKSEQLFLAGTSEPSLLAYFADKVLDEKDLPIKVCALTQCYRSEVGSYGKDTHGIFRIHEFAKTEQVILCKNNIEESNIWLDQMCKTSESILQDLELPYRVIQIASGDMGAGKYKMYDIETWFPSQNTYRETHSDSNLTDWQPRRLNIKYIDSEGKKQYVYALNNTAIASPRILIGLIENHQQKDGSIKIPKKLIKYTGFDKISKK